MESTIYKPVAYKSPGVYKGTGGIYKGRGVYNDGAGGGEFVKIGGRKYKVVTIGNLKWIAENLDYKFEVNGQEIPIGANYSITSPAAWYYNNNEPTYGIDGVYKCGLLYNAFAAEYLEQNKIDLLPNGWRVPSATDFINLRDYINNSSKKIKSKDNSVFTGFPTSWNGTDDFKFSLNPCGCYQNSVFKNLNYAAYLYSGYVNTYGYASYCISDSDNFYINALGFKTHAYSIRLCKDA